MDGCEALLCRTMMCISKQLEKLIRPCKDKEKRILKWL